MLEISAVPLKKIQLRHYKNASWWWRWSTVPEKNGRRCSHQKWPINVPSSPLKRWFSCHKNNWKSPGKSWTAVDHLAALWLLKAAYKSRMTGDQWHIVVDQNLEKTYYPVDVLQEQITQKKHPRVAQRRVEFRSISLSHCCLLKERRSEYSALQHDPAAALRSLAAAFWPLDDFLLRLVPTLTRAKTNYVFSLLPKWR